MKEEIIKLAKEKGFEPISLAARGYQNYYDTYKHDSIEYYLWLCELQKWLRERYKIGFLPSHMGNLSKFFIYFLNKDYNDPDVEDGSPEFETDWCKKYDKALESGCFEALKLIK